MHKVLVQTFEGLDQEGIHYCLLRDCEDLDQFDTGGELDLLVPRDHLDRLQALLSRLGFVSLPNWGHAPHHFFLAYHRNSDTWLKLDVVTEIAYGQRTHALRTSLGVQCLRGRRRAGSAFIPSPEDELVTLLLHCLLDKGTFAPSRRARLTALCRQVGNEPVLSRMVADFFGPAASWPKIAAYIEAGDWAALLALREIVTSKLEAQQRLHSVWRRMRDRLLRKLSVWTALLFPRSPAVALLAPDGAGKSTLATNLVQSFLLPARYVYMGLYQKHTGASRCLGHLPGLGFLRLLFTQWCRYLRARYHQAQGRLVIFDRYPYDALLPPLRRLGWIKQCRRRLLAIACPAPDLVVLLDAPGQVLYARKREHSPEFLERQRQGYLGLRQHLPQAIVVDATMNPDSVRRAVTDLIWDACARRLRTCQ